MQDFCSECGSPTITKCQHCGSEIRGYYNVPGVIAIPHYSLKAYCHQCGQPYPWTEARLKAAEELILLGEVPEADKQALIADLPALTVDTPRTPVAMARMSRFLSRAGAPIAAAVRDILVDIAGETVKKSLGL